MVSVTQLIKKTKQPFGGYLPIKKFISRKFHTNLHGIENENINPSIVGMAVDYLTRLKQGSEVEDAFQVPLKGAIFSGNFDKAYKLLDKVMNDNEKKSITAACKLVEFDVAYRTGMYIEPKKDIKPNKETLENIVSMVDSSCSYLDDLGGTTWSGFTFEGAYEISKITKGDGDFLTKNSLVDFKISTRSPTSKDTLQILIYYVLGIHSKEKIYFSDIEFLRIFNPRLGFEWYISVHDINDHAIDSVCQLIFPQEV